MIKVQLVEDDPTMLNLLKTLLEIEGFQVFEIQDFGNIVGETKVNGPDVVLMDVHLEDVSGIETLVAMRADGDFSGTKIIMSSGMDFNEECRQKGADDFLLKPYMPDELIAKIKTMMG